ncbi:MAG: hypothetical protein GKS05_13120 [Nitrospirales bacterium]|nr:hypothetical protein [Nitrospirales bacterium]
MPLWEPISTTRSSSKSHNHQKVISRDVLINGKPRTIKIIIYEGGGQGLPNTIDLEFFRAFEQLATEQLHQTGYLKNPIRVTGQEMLRAAKRPRAGWTYDELRRFFRKMASTTIGAIRDVEKKKHKELLFHIFETVVQEGDTREDGSVATVHEIELPSWYLNSLNSGNCLVVDHQVFQNLTRPMAKLLHQVLHSLFYLGKGTAQQLYSEVASNWQITCYGALSRIKQQLDPAHIELQRQGFLEAWTYERTEDKQDWKIQWTAGQQWWFIYRAHQELLPDATDAPHDPFLLEEPIPPIPSDQQAASNDRMVEEIVQFLGHKDGKYRPFWKQAARDIPHPILFRLIGEVKEKIHDRTVKNKGSYLLSLIRVEGRKCNLPWAMKE